MASAYNMVVGASLAVLLALMVGMLLAGAWRHLTRQLTRGGLVVFLIGAGIATVDGEVVANCLDGQMEGTNLDGGFVWYLRARLADWVWLYQQYDFGFNIQVDKLSSTRVKLNGSGIVNERISGCWYQGALIKTTKGSVITRAFFENAQLFQHFNYLPYASFESDYDITVTGEKTIYLAFRAWDASDWYSAIGWVELKVDAARESVEIVGSAITEDEDSITVGAYQGGVVQMPVGYVDASVVSSGDGSSWVKAAKTISEMSEKIADGGTLYVKAGVYTGDFTFPAINNRFTIIAVDGPDRTVIERGAFFYVSRVLTVEWQTLLLRGFTLRNMNEAISQARIESCRLTGGQRELAWDCELVGCLICGNNNPHLWMSYLYNCTIADNTGTESVLSSCNAYNCIFWNNISTGYPEYGIYPPTLDANQYNCVTNDQGFVDPSHGDYHLKMASTCINAGANMFVSMSSDYDGNPRIQRNVVDVGCYEYQPTNEHQTITAPEPVEFAWIDESCPEVLAECGGDYDKAVLMKSANPVDISLPEPMRTYYSIWESYVADLDPTDSNQTFRATIEMVDGKPVVKGDPESPRRKYTVLGKEKLADEKWQENLPGAQFFKVKVGLK